MPPVLQNYLVKSNYPEGKYSDNWDNVSEKKKKDHIREYSIVHVWEVRNKKTAKNYPEIYERANKGAKVLAEQTRKMLLGLKKWNDLADKEGIEKRMSAKDKDEDEKRKEEMKSSPMNLNLKEQYTYDYAIVFRLKEHIDDASHDEYDSCLEEYMDIARVLDYFRYSDLNTFLYLGEDDPKTGEGRLICLLGACEERLREEAKRVEFDSLLRPDKIKEIGCTRKPPFILAQQVANDKEYAEFTDDLFMGIYGIYKDFAYEGRHSHVESELESSEYHQSKQQLYWTYDDTPYRPKSQFTELSRLKLTKIIIEAEKDLHGASLTLAAATRNKKYPVIGFFAMHEPADREELQRKFRESCSVVRDVCCCGDRFELQFSPDEHKEEKGDDQEESCKCHDDTCVYNEDTCCYQCNLVSYTKSDLHWKVRNYFGENVGLYFQFLTHYAIWLLPVAIIGTIIFIHQVVMHETAGDDYTIGNYIFVFDPIL